MWVDRGGRKGIPSDIHNFHNIIYIHKTRISKSTINPNKTQRTWRKIITCSTYSRKIWEYLRKDRRISFHLVLFKG